MNQIGKPDPDAAAPGEKAVSEQLPAERKNLQGEMYIKLSRAAAIAAGLALVALVAGIAAMAWQAQVERRERARAEQRLGDARRLADAFLSEFHDSIKNHPDATQSRKLMVLRVLEYLDGPAREFAGDQSLQNELATAYERVGEIQGDPYTANLGDPAGAGESFRKALAIRESLVAARPDDSQLKLDLSSTHVSLGEILEFSGNITGALDHHRKALALREAFVAAEPVNFEARREVARSYGYIGNCMARIGKDEEALEAYRKSLAINQELLKGSPADKALKRSTAVVLWRIGNHYVRKEEFDNALSNYREAQPLFEALAEDQKNVQARRELSQFYEDLASTLMKKNLASDANAILRKSRELQQGD